VECSFVIPAHDEAALLPATLAALGAAIEELGLEAEIIVVDDASTDGTGELARAAGARVVEVELRHIAAVRNAGLRAATGDVVVFVDADTLVPAATVRAALDAVGSGAVGGGAWVRLAPGAPRLGAAFVWAIGQVYTRAGLAAGCFLYARRSVLEAAGGWDERGFAGEEAWTSLALRRHGRFRIVRPAVVTSDRKLREHSIPAMCLVMARIAARTLLGRPASRKGHELWYEPRRSPPADR